MVQPAAVPVPQADVCSRFATCELFARLHTIGACKVFQVSYCMADYGRCVRFERISRGERVAANLLPNGKSL
jgi:hypothetical protein